MRIAKDDTQYDIREKFQSSIHRFSTKRTYDVQNMLRIIFFSAQSQYEHQLRLSGKENFQNRIDLFYHRPIITLNGFYFY
jgi:hypothetical protein